MPANPTSAALQQLLAQQKREAEQQRQQHERDKQLQQQQWQKENQAQRQRQRYEQQSVRQTQQSERQQLQGKQQISRGVLESLMKSMSGISAAMLMPVLQGTGEWNKLNRKHQDMIRRARGGGATGGEILERIKEEDKRGQQRQGNRHKRERLAVMGYHEQRRLDSRYNQQQKQHALGITLQSEKRKQHDRHGEERFKARELERDANARFQADTRAGEKEQREQQRATQARAKAVADKHAQRGREMRQGGMQALQGAMGANAGSLAGGLGTMMAGGPAGAAAQIVAQALEQAAIKSARSIEVLNNSTLNAGQKMDALAKEWIPGAAAFIALRQAVSGVNDALRRMHIQFALAQIRQTGAAEVSRVEMRRDAEVDGFGNRAVALEAYRHRLAMKPPPIMPRGTMAEEVAYENQMRLLPHKYALGRAEAEAAAAKKTYQQRQTDTNTAETAEAKLLDKRGKYTMPFQNDPTKAGGGAMGKLHEAKEDARLDVNFWGARTDEHKVAINDAALKAALAIRAVEQSRVQVEEAINRQKQAGLTLAEKESAVRKAQFGMDRAELENKKAKEQRSAGLANKIGSMSKPQQAKMSAMLKLAEKHGLENLPPSMRQQVAQFMPGMAQKQYEKSAPKTDLWKQAVKMGGKDTFDEKGDFAGMRKEIQQKAAQVEVRVILDEAAMAEKIAKVIETTMGKLIQQIKVKTENKEQERIRDQTQKNANQ